MVTLFDFKLSYPYSIFILSNIFPILTIIIIIILILFVLLWLLFTISILCKRSHNFFALGHSQLRDGTDHHLPSLES